jgi:uncharacterized protein HemY
LMLAEFFILRHSVVASTNRKRRRMLDNLIQLAGYTIVTIAVFFAAILIVIYVILPFMAWVVKKVLGE